jgi:hypothetical protein
VLFKTDMGGFVRLYTFLSQMFDYGNTAIEKRAIFYKRLLPLLEFGREREGIDLSKVVLTHHTIRSLGKHAMPLAGQATKLEPLTEAGSGSVQEREKARLNEIIEKVNDLFEGELTDEDKLVYVNNVIKGKLLESEKLRQQATNNTKEQFANSPDLHAELMNAIMDALDAHTAMSTQALNSQAVQRGLVLLEQAVDDRLQGSHQFTLRRPWLELDGHDAIDLEVVVMPRGVEFGAEVEDQVGVGRGRQFGRRIVGLEGLKDLGGVVDEIHDVSRVFAWMGAVEP